MHHQILYAANLFFMMHKIQKGLEAWIAYQGKDDEKIIVCVAIDIGFLVANAGLRCV
ncbi:hypothetical protein [Chlamydia suis]|uniref:hypothetical protein n=1 Tax=Chlamydia suis TaxID=83559 RepID=UPI0013A532ED|nr:hypothetical protein [Chlamydia suis]